jgi:hypothetical protein
MNHGLDDTGDGHRNEAPVLGLRRRPGYAETMPRRAWTPLLFLACLWARMASAQLCPECLTPTVVGVGNTVFTGSATGCTLPAEGCGIPSFNTRFFSFTPTQGGTYRISTCIGASSSELTVLTAWNGCQPTDFVACGVAGCPGGGGAGSLIGSIDLVAGVPCLIGVGAHCCGESFISGGTLTIVPVDPPGTGCATATTAVVGPNQFDTTSRNEIVDLAGACDPLPQGGEWDDRIYNAQYFRFTPPASGAYTIRTCDEANSVYERLAVFAGCPPTGTVLACSDGTCGDEAYGRIIGVQMSAGTQYTILVGGITAGNSGPGQFVIAPAQPCDLPPATTQESEACGEDLNSGCLSSSRPADPIALGDTVRGTIWAVDDARDTDWFVFELAEGTEVTLRLDSSQECMALFFREDCSTSLFFDQAVGRCPALTDGECLPAGRYYVVVVPEQFWTIPCGHPVGNDYALTVTGKPCDASPPPNDRCIDALAVPEGSTAFDNFFAGTDYPGMTCSSPFAMDVWFAFTATVAGDHRISACTGKVPFNTGLDVWTACPEAGGQVIACNDDSGNQACGSGSSAVVMPLGAGQTVLIRVGSTVIFDALSGSGTLVVERIGSELVCGDPDAGDCCTTHGAPFCRDMECCNTVCNLTPECCGASWDELCVAVASLYCYAACGQPPANDLCSSPRAAARGSNPFSNVRAEGSAATTCGTVHSDVWYRYTAEGSGAVTVSFCAADGGWAMVTGGSSGELDARIAVFEECTGTPIACSDNACGVRPRVTFAPQCGGTYLIAVGSRDAAEGIYSQGVGAFTISQPGSCGAGCPADLNDDAFVDGDDLGVLLGAWGACGAGACPPDINGDGFVNGDDLGVMLGAWGACP